MYESPNGPVTEVIVVPTYKRPELLHECLTRIRMFTDMPVSIFPDHATAKDADLLRALHFSKFLQRNMQLNFVPDHEYYGNSFNTMEALRWAHNEGYDRVYYVEDDVMVHHDFFEWHRAQHDDEDFEIFASLGWIFNLDAPMDQATIYQPWYYSIGSCFSHKQLGHVIEHASPLYYQDLQGYIDRTFKDQKIAPYGIQHYEQDGLIQRVLDRCRAFSSSCGIAKCKHLGTYGYNRGWANPEIFDGTQSFEDRINAVNAFANDPHARAEYFGRPIVEREIGHVLPKREFKYKVTLPGGWESELKSEQSQRFLPKRINSAPLPPEAQIVLQ